MRRPHRHPRATAIARPMSGSRLMNDFANDWQHWSPTERSTAGLLVLLATTAGLAWIVLAG
jgi:hypothetical protein